MADIKTTLKVDGESKFEKDIKAAARSVKNLGENLKLSQEEFKRDGDQMKLVSERSKTLNAQIDQQEKIVKALAQAVKDSSEKYGEASTQTEKWQTELTKAQTTLTALQNELNNNAQGLDKNGKAFSDMAGKAEEAKQKMTGIDFLAIDTAIGNVTDTAKNAAKAILNVGKSVWNMVSDSAHWADDLTTRANAASAVGVDRQTLQAWDYAAKIVDTDSDTIIDGINRILDRTTSGKESDLLMFNPLVKTTDEVTGKLRGAQDIFWDTIEALHNITDGNEQAARAQDIFGRNGFAKLMPLIKAGREEWQKYAKEAQDAGYVLSEDQLDSLGGFDDAIQRMETSAQSMRNTLSAELAPAMKTVADAITTITDKITEWANTEEGQKALEALGNAITSVVEALTKDVDFTDLATKAAGVLTGIGDALSWVSTHPETVLNGIKDALSAYAGLKVSSSLISLLTALGGLKNLTAGTVSAVKGILQSFGSGKTSVPVSNENLNQAKNSAVTHAAVSNAGTSLAIPAAALSAATAMFLAGSKAQWDENAAVEKAVKTAVTEIKERAEETTETIVQKFGADVAAKRDVLIGKANAALALVQDTSMGSVPGVGMYVGGMTQNHSALVDTIEYLKENKETVRKLLSPETYEKLLNADTKGGLLGIGSMSDQGMWDLVKSVSDEMSGEGGPVETAEEVNARLETMKKDADDAKAAVKELYQELDEKYGVVQNGQTGQFELVNSDNSQEARDGIAALNELYAKAAELKADYEAAGEDIPAGLASGIEKNTQTAADAADTMATDTENAAERRLGINSPSTVFRDIGANVAIGLGEGIYSQANYAISAARWLAAEIEAATRTALDIHSPSGVAEELGEYYGLGFISGIENSMGGIDAAFARMANESLVMQAPPAAGSASQTAGGGVDLARLLLDALSNAVVQIDGENAGRLMLPTIEALMAEQVASRRFA